jgi:type VI secretion system secreted protein Hcp
VAIYMKYGALLGDVGESGHANWIELTSVSWGLNRPVSNPAATSDARVVSAPRVTELVITKDEDVASIPLIQEALGGSPVAVQIDFVRTGGDKAEVYYTIMLTDALLTAFSQAGSGDRPAESLTLNFTAISVQGSQMAKDGSGESPSSYAWSLTNNAPA